MRKQTKATKQIKSIRNILEGTTPFTDLYRIFQSSLSLLHVFFVQFLMC